jgi:hypothetical protein
LQILTDNASSVGTAVRGIAAVAVVGLVVRFRRQL